MTMLWVALGAAVGAPLRFLVSRQLDRGRSRASRAIPLGTLVVNVAGSFVLGWVVSSESGPTMAALLGTGFCGALTTYSTFSYENWQLIEAGAGLRAALNIAANLLVGFGAAALGWAAGS
jgi:CrcB protein